MACADALHPLAFVTSTEIGPALETTFVTVVTPFDHKYVLPEGAAVSVVLPPGQMPSVPDIETTGNALTVTVTDAEVVVPQPLPSLCVTK